MSKCSHHVVALVFLLLNIDKTKVGRQAGGGVGGDRGGSDSDGSY